MVIPRDKSRVHRHMTVVSWTPMRRNLVIIGLLAAIVGCSAAGYLFGKRHSDFERNDLGRLGERISALELELESTARQLADANLAREVDRQALAIQREEMAGQEAANRELQVQLALYRRLMDESPSEQGLEIADIEVIAVDRSDRYEYRLLLTRPTGTGDWISGNVRLDVAGRQYGQDGERVLSLPEIADMDSYPLKFRFRYIQRLTGQLTLPDGFHPQRVTVRLAVSGEQDRKIDRSFPWPDDSV